LAWLGVGELSAGLTGLRQRGAGSKIRDTYMEPFIGIRMNSYSFAQFSTLLSRVVEAFIMKRQVKNSSIGIDLDGYSGDE